MIKPKVTYIEKDKDGGDRVFIVNTVTDRYVTGSFVNVVKWRKSSSRIKRAEFVKRFEVSPIQMN